MSAAPARRTPLVLLTALLTLLVLAGCGERETSPGGNGADAANPGPSASPDAGASGGGAAGMCVAAIRYDDALYISVGSGNPERGQRLAGAEIPPCNDTGDVGEAPASPVDAFEIGGVDPQYAVTAGDGPSSMVYVREGYVPGMVDAEPLPPGVADALGLATD